MSITYRQHRIKWNTCQACTLCSTRRNVVLARGSLPCDVLFIGEAPGASEDTIGQPFIGPAGKLLDRLIEKATDRRNDYRIAFTNLIACIPKEDGDKVTAPPKESVEACRPRLLEMIQLARPQAIVRVGEHSKRYVEAMLTVGALRTTATIVDITHPAAILRMDVTQQGLAAQRATVIIADVLDDLIPF